MTPTSRPLLVSALAVLAIAGFAPVVMMLSPLVERAAADGIGVFFAGVYDERTVTLLARTAKLGLTAAGIAVLLGAPFGFFVARTDIPCARLLRAAGLVPFILPPLVLAMTWTMMLDWREFKMASRLLGLATFPVVALFTARAFEQVDARREEAARLAGGLPAVLRMELPLVLPNVLAGACLAFSFAINDFSLPDYVSAVGRKFGVYAAEIFTAAKVADDRARATAIALPLIALTLVALVPALALRRRGVAVAAGDFQRPEPLPLGRWRWPAFSFCAALVLVGAVIPMGRLLYEAGGGPRLFGAGSIRRAAWTQGGGAAQVAPPAAQPGAATADPSANPAADPAARAAAVAAAAAAARSASRGSAPAPSPAPRVPQPTNSAAAGTFKPESPEAAAAIAAAEAEAANGGQDPLRNAPLLERFAAFAQNVRRSFARALELSRGSLVASLGFAFTAATLAVPLALVLGHAAARRRRGWWIEALAVGPIAAPAILFGIGAIGAWNHGPTAAVYESGAIVVLLYIGRFLVFPTLALSRASASLDPRLEEAGALAGAGPARRLGRIVAPNIWPALLGAWTLVFVLSVRELDAAILVPAANDTVLFRVFNAVHFGRDDFVSALCLLVVFALLLPGLLWSIFARRRMEFLP